MHYIDEDCIPAAQNKIEFWSKFSMLVCLELLVFKFSAKE